MNFTGADWLEFVVAFTIVLLGGYMAMKALWRDE